MRIPALSCCWCVYGRLVLAICGVAGLVAMAVNPALANGQQGSGAAVAGHGSAGFLALDAAGKAIVGPVATVEVAPAPQDAPERDIPEQDTPERHAPEQEVAEQDVALTAKTLQLRDGRLVRLAAIQAPNPGAPLYDEAWQLVQRQVAQGAVTLHPVSRKPDRRGRVIALVDNAAGESLQAHLLRAGLAWVYSFPDSAAHAPALLAAEEEARVAGRGVWAHPDYTILKADSIPKTASGFRVVEGRVHAVAERRGRIFINFDEDWKRDFTLVIAPRHVRHFDRNWLESLAGERVRVRGWLYRSNGPAIEVTHQEQIERL